MLTKKKEFFYFSIFAVALIILTNQPSKTPQERYECTGVIFNRVLTKVEVYDEDRNLISSKLYEEIEGERTEAKGNPVVLKPNAKLSVIYTPRGFWSGLLRSFSSGALNVYEESMDITKYFRVDRYSYLFYMKDKDGKEWGNFDTLKNKIYLGLPRKDDRPVAFSGTCRRTF
jgi:hypothetical protein